MMDDSGDLITPLALNALEKSVEDLGGQARPGQIDMVKQVCRSLNDSTHLLVQAGTGTGKSLGYLIPSLIWAMKNDARVVIATATLALQHQLAKKDIPTASAAVEKICGRYPRTQIVKGRSNYACLWKVREGAFGEQASLFDADELLNSSQQSTVSRTGAEVVALRQWAEDQRESGGWADRDEAPRHSAQAWMQVSATSRECLGSSLCEFGGQCFAEKARLAARQADVVVTNHALLAIDALYDGAALPEHEAVILDEAHELTDRITDTISAHLSLSSLKRLLKNSYDYLSDETWEEFDEAIASFEEELTSHKSQRLDKDDPLIASTAQLRSALRSMVSALTSGSSEDPQRHQLLSQLKETFEIAERIATYDDCDVIWVSSDQENEQINVAPLSVSGLLRENILSQRTAILTSATLTLGEQFTSVAQSVGLRKGDRVELDQISEEPFAWRACDVGSPFNYPGQGILYIASDLPAPSREGLNEKMLERMTELIAASEGHCLGLFTSLKAAQTAAKEMRERLPHLDFLVQGEGHLAQLTKRFADDESASLFGTLSLWQGIDIPGDSCRLVIIDRIPFPRPDDPLIQARQEAIAKAGGNGFMSVAATGAALLLAQGVGRLIRRSDDRGLVAILDSRLRKARYGNFLISSLPPLWKSENRGVVLDALRRLAHSTSS